MTPFLLFAIVFGLSVAVGFRGNRVVASVVLLPSAAFCGFGFLASFEPGVQVFWKIGYAISGLACFVGGVYRWLPGCCDDPHDSSGEEVQLQHERYSHRPRLATDGGPRIKAMGREQLEKSRSDDDDSA